MRSTRPLPPKACQFSISESAKTMTSGRGKQPQGSAKIIAHPVMRMAELVSAADYSSVKSILSVVEQLDQEGLSVSQIGDRLRQTAPEFGIAEIKHFADFLSRFELRYGEADRVRRAVANVSK